MQNVDLIAQCLLNFILLAQLLAWECTESQADVAYVLIFGCMTNLLTLRKEVELLCRCPLLYSWLYCKMLGGLSYADKLFHPKVFCSAYWLQFWFEHKVKKKQKNKNGAGGRQNNLNLILPFFHPVIRFVLCSDVSQEAAGMTPQFYWKGFFFSFWSVWRGGKKNAKSTFPLQLSSKIFSNC